MVCSRSGVRLYADTRCYVYTYLVRIPFLFDFPFDEIYRRLLLFTLTRYVCMYNTCRCTMNSTSVSLFVRSLVGGGTHDTYVPPVDAHVWRQLHVSAVARCSDSYCIFFYHYFLVLILLSICSYYHFVISIFLFLFERSEFVIDTSPPKKLCVCTANNIGFKGSLKRYCYRYVCTTRIMYRMRMYLVSCEKHGMVVYIHEPYPWAQSVVAGR